jgi:D-alanine-D-alanine ligase-like ATP-grasp enzyme
MEKPSILLVYNPDLNENALRRQERRLSQLRHNLMREGLQRFGKSGIHIITTPYSGIDLKNSRVYLLSNTGVGKRHLINPICTYRVTMHPEVHAICKKLEELGIACFNSPIVSSITSDKDRVHMILKNKGVPTPETYCVSKNSGRYEILHHLPCISSRRIVVKPNDGTQSMGVRQFDKRDVKNIADHSVFLLANQDAKILLQEAMPFRLSYKVLMCRDDKDIFAPYYAQAQLMLSKAQIPLYLNRSLFYGYLGLRLSLLRLGNSLDRDDLDTQIQAVVLAASQAIESYFKRKYKILPGVLSLELMFRVKQRMDGKPIVEPVVLEVNSMPGSPDLSHADELAGVSDFREAEAASILRLFHNEMNKKGGHGSLSRTTNLTQHPKHIGGRKWANAA